MTPWNLRRRFQRRLIDLPGPVGSLFFSILGPVAKAQGESEPAESPPVPAARATGAPAGGSHAPKNLRDDDEPGATRRPSLSVEDEKALKESKPTPPPRGEQGTTWCQVARKDEIPPGTGRKVKALGREYALFHLDDGFYAIDNACAHAAGSLGDGELVGRIVTCGEHGWTYDVTSGECVSRPGNRVAKVDVRYDGDRILLPT